MRPATLVALFLSVCSIAALAATPYPVVDLKTIADSTASSTPAFYTSVNGVALFTATANGSGGLWRTDGTATGTSLLKPFPAGGFGGVVSNGTTAWFSIYDSSGWGIWRTDGRTATAVLTGYIDPILMITTLGGNAYAAYGNRDLWVVDSAHATSLTLLTPVTSYRLSAATSGNILYVATNAGVWRTDGTKNGTKKISPNSGYALTIANGRLFYGGQTFDDGIELWVSDGNSAGTLVTDLTPGTESTFGVNSVMESLGDRVLLLAANGDLITSDGTASGTSRIGKGAPPVSTTSIVRFNGLLYFSWGDHLWRSDTTEGGTESVYAETVYSLYPTDSRLWFMGGNVQGDRTIFSSDGTPQGTTSIAKAGQNSITLAGGNVFFSGNDAYHGIEPWVTDGTPAGSHLIVNLADDKSGSSNPRDLVGGASRLFFRADNNAGTDLYSTDGTSAGTQSILHSTIGSQSPRLLTTVGDTLYLANTRQLLASDGTSAPAVVHAFAGSDETPANALVTGNRLFFNAGRNVFTSDGTDAGTIPVTNTSSTMSPPVASAGRIYTMQSDKGVLYEIGTTAAAAHSLARSNESGSNLVPMRGSLMFLAGTHVWKFSGGGGDATLVKTLPPGRYPQLGATGSTGDAVFFSWVTDAGAPQLWKSDGTADGTVMLKQFAASGFGEYSGFTALGNRMLFACYNAGVSRLWVSDGTADGTKVLADATPTGTSNSPFHLVVADGLAYFVADHQLWQTDGTPEGTKSISGASGVTEAGVARAGNTLYFAANTKEQGTELWAYPLPGSVAAAVDDVRVNENAGHASVTVRLTRNADQRVSVGYETADVDARAGRDYTSTSGTITFEAGEAVKTISIPITDDDVPGVSRAFLVRLKDASVAIEKAVGSVAIDDDDQAADVELVFNPHGPSFELRNHGPSAATNVVFCVTATGVTPVQSCDEPIELASGESYPYYNYVARTVDLVLTGRATQWERDPVPSNNASAWKEGTGDIYISPAALRPGDHATVALSQSFSSDVVFTSSDPSVIRINTTNGSSDRKTWYAAVTALKIGSATISDGVSKIVVQVAETVRDTSFVTFGGFGSTPRFGDATELYAIVGGGALDGSVPTGSVEFLQDGLSLGTAPLIASKATLVSSTLQPGTHQFVAKYSGDARVAASTSSVRVFGVQKGSNAFSATARGDGSIVIVVRGLDGYPPAGSALLEEDHAISRGTCTLAPAGPATASCTVSGFSAEARTVTIGYSGDSHYDAATPTIPITGTHRRTAGR